MEKQFCRKDSSILFFILIFLLLFYDNSALYGWNNVEECNKGGDSTILFFILIFLLLFY